MVRQAILGHKVIIPKHLATKVHEIEVFVQDNEAMVCVSHANQSWGEEKENTLVWPVEHAPSHLSTHSADTGLNGRHATNITQY